MPGLGSAWGLILEPSIVMKGKPFQKGHAPGIIKVLPKSCLPPFFAFSRSDQKEVKKWSERVPQAPGASVGPLFDLFLH